MKDLHKKLIKKGWLETFAIWLFLIISILGTFVISVALVPFLLVMQGVYLYCSLVGMGLFFGVLIKSAVIHVQKIQVRSFIMPHVLLPVLALINAYLITSFSNDLIKLLKLPVLQHSPTLVSIVYILAFLLPYFLEFGLRPHTRK